jgi:hypothetical protein
LQARRSALAKRDLIEYFSDAAETAAGFIAPKN